jgi:restriction system protein
LAIGLLSAAAGILPGRLRRALTAAVKPRQSKNAQSDSSPPLHFSEKRSIQDLDWDEFELLVSELYRRRGFKVEFGVGTGPDNGIDVILKKGEERALVQCKHWKAWKVGVKELREFFGVLISDGAARGIFVTSKSFTREALDFANGKPIDLITGGGLQVMLEESGLIEGGKLRGFDEWVPGLVKHATIPVPSCPNCGKTMNRKKSKGGIFWGCSGFPHCFGKRNVRRHLDGSHVLTQTPAEVARERL